LLTDKQTNKQTNKVWQKHYLLGRSNKCRPYSVVVCIKNTPRIVTRGQFSTANIFLGEQLRGQTATVREHGGSSAPCLFWRRPCL